MRQHLKRIARSRSRLQSSMESPLFVHQPRTGGTSVEKLIGREEHRHRPASSRASSERWRRACVRFSSVRNPYEWMWSLYHTLGDTSKTFRQWSKNPGLEGGMGLCQSENILGVDEVVHLERIDEELPALLSRYGVVIDAPIPHVNKASVRPDMSDDCKNLVRILCRRDFVEFGYEE